MGPKLVIRRDASTKRNTQTQARSGRPEESTPSVSKSWLTRIRDGGKCCAGGDQPCRSPRSTDTRGPTRSKLCAGASRLGGALGCRPTHLPRRGHKGEAPRGAASEPRVAGTTEVALRGATRNELSIVRSVARKPPTKAWESNPRKRLAVPLGVALFSPRRRYTNHPGHRRPSCSCRCATRCAVRGSCGPALRLVPTRWLGCWASTSRSRRPHADGDPMIDLALDFSKCCDRALLREAQRGRRGLLPGRCWPASGHGPPKANGLAWGGLKPGPQAGARLPCREAQARAGAMRAAGRRARARVGPRRVVA